MTRIASIMWNTHVPMLARAAKQQEDIDLVMYSSKTLENEAERFDEVFKALEQADIILLYRSATGFWDALEERIEEIGKKVPIVCTGYDPSLWSLSTFSPETVQQAYNYISFGGDNNFFNLLRFVKGLAEGDAESAPKPVFMPWEGLYHPESQVTHFENLESYQTWYNEYLKTKGLENAPQVGILIPRHTWITGNMELEDCLIRELENQGLACTPVFSYSSPDKDNGAKGSIAMLEEVFFNSENSPRIHAFIKLQMFLLGIKGADQFSDERANRDGVAFFKRLGVPVFQPIVSLEMTPEEWEASPQGLSNVAFTVALPEFEGVIEPMMVGCAEREQDDATGAVMEKRTPIPERVRRLSKRVARWVSMGLKPVSERKVAFILHNNPCASVEATVGGAAKLDSLESVARVLQAMKAKGYSVDPPETGEELITTIMDRKAVSEFRWTTTDEIVRKGGDLCQLDLPTYLKWWETFPPAMQERIAEAWGAPPGEEKNGVPAAMLYDGKILITGVSYGNAVVCVQPKRGCAGTKCDGVVCKILHDPDVPPPHQYIATYRWLENEFGADAFVHVGTHGNVEFLPGKSVGLSESCLPDICIHETPHLYIYNSDNPSEGTIAKRRSYATLVNHMQTVMGQGGLYGDLEELDGYLDEYEKAKTTEKNRAHTLSHLIVDTVRKTNLDKQIKLTDDMPMDEIVRRTHDALSKIRNTYIPDGMHVFGKVPEEEARIEFLWAILRYDAGDPNSLRKILCRSMGHELLSLMNDEGAVDPRTGKSHGMLMEEIEALGVKVVEQALQSVNGEEFLDRTLDLLGDLVVDRQALTGIASLLDRILDLNVRVGESKEIDALLSGFEAKYIPAGPSGLIMRGRDDILPTGRNFYSLDPNKIPTKAAFRVGEKLSEAVLEKYLTEEGAYPENVGIFWMAGDIMWSDGEGMGQILALIGARPKWLAGGRVQGFEIIPLEELGRPRVDVTIRVSGIARDNFPNCIEYVDEVIQAVAALDEPVEQNYVRKHTLEQLAEEGGDETDSLALRRATYRVFSAQPGTYRAGVNLAVYASAWKTEADLSDIFMFWNGYAYGKGVFGEPSHKQLAGSLKTVSLTFNKVVADENDLFNCCCYFGTHGGMTAAARTLSQKPVKTYYGDTREPERVQVRDLADEVRRVVRTKLLNPKWIDGMKRHGYKGAGDISKRVGRVYGWESTTQEVDDWIFDDITRTFVLDEENREFFRKHNPWALEEISRRLLEAESRGLWEADPEVLEELKEHYLELEGWIEEYMGDVEGDFQGGAVDMFTPEDVAAWKAEMDKLKDSWK
ncbi:cobaltochelatase CobN subunit [Desulfatibacillum alkenivorans DSM 16219]|uniref:Cobaltochelatase CobN subunit n=1 Tax=Desulfatibacillum alkenivorans DSM 16219 TaxID=1121393 RepID=A0A1M6JX50_9BACT|nr:cobaltochelatase subunit CobN [Desulfatibacillum alkenivorans]SHJ51228.1 cobaltochelatase CobN subunit [Desulfatibacillum alkenivorans DSM 16219]